jgi:hypothetical protein
MHELSVDSISWVRASSYPQLFVSDGNTSSNDSQRPADAVKTEIPPQPPVRQWWYGKNGTEAGPVDQMTLQRMLAMGSLNADDRVWTDGMPQWVPARQVPGLVLPPTSVVAGGLVAADGLQKDELPATLCRSAVSSRPWVLFYAIVCFVFGGLAMVAGVFGLVRGIGDHLPPVAAWGLFVIIFALDYICGGFLLLNHASRLGGLRHSPQAPVLEKALDALHTFWFFVGMNLIIALAAIVVAVVWVIAVGVTLPW